MKLGFIGAGNMAGAILQGAIVKGFLLPDEIMVYDIDSAQYTKIHALFPAVKTAESVAELVAACDYVVLAVKPIYLEPVLREIQPHIRGKRIISIVTGWSFADLTQILDEQSGGMLLRVMPNTPVMVNEGFTALCEETTFDEASLCFANQLFQTLGKTEIVPERLFGAVIATCGSSPAYVYMFIEAMADGAVRLGMPRKMAYQAAAQAVRGAAKMVLETGQHPGKLKDDVCSPGGTTIEAVKVLEQKAMKGAVLAAMEACADKNCLLEKNK